MSLANLGKITSTLVPLLAETSTKGVGPCGFIAMLLPGDRRIPFPFPLGLLLMPLLMFPMVVILAAALEPSAQVTRRSLCSGAGEFGLWDGRSSMSDLLPTRIRGNSRRRG